MTTTIVVGAGSSGAVVAGRLAADPSQRVILIEAGPDYPTAAVPPELREADAFDPLLFGHDWGLLCEAVEPPGSRQPVPYPRGRLTGGSGAVNGAVAQRGTREDFAAWEAAGNDAWGWEAVLDDYRGLERDLDFGESPGHGAAGPVPIGRPPRDAWPRFARSFEQAALERGFPACEDSNAPDATGVGPFPRNVEGPLRASSAAVYLEPVRDRPNLELHAETTVDRVLLDRGRAVGVEARNAAGEPRRIEADRVVLCGGFAKSPQILMLSGIGPAAELRRHAIEVEVDLPVGETLCDHPSFILFGFATDASGSQFGPRVQLRSGSTPDGVNDLLLIPALVEPGSLGIVTPSGVSSLAMISAAVARPRSRGSLRLASPDPSHQPEIRLNLLGEPADVEKARQAVRLAFELATTAPLAGEIAGLLTELPDLDDEPAFDAWLRANVTTSMHGACTCRMGPADDERAVVGQDLAVHGVEGLYVADASVMPELTTGAVNLTCMLIGERLARSLLAAG